MHASTLDALSARDMVEGLTGRFDDHHAELARMLLDRILRPRRVASPCPVTLDDFPVR